MKFEIGWVVVILAIVFFYFRMYQLRGKRRREARQEELTRLKAGAKRKSTDAPLAPNSQVTYQVGSWVLLGLGAALMLLGLAMRTTTWIPAALLPYWWAVTALGVVTFTLGFK